MHNESRIGVIGTNAKVVLSSIVGETILLSSSTMVNVMTQDAELSINADEDATASDEKILQQFADDKAKYKEELKDKNKTASEKAEIRKNIKRIDLMEKILIAEIDEMTDKLPKLIKKLESTYSPEQTQEITVTVQNTTNPDTQTLGTPGDPSAMFHTSGAHNPPITETSSSNSGWSTVVKKFNCDIQFYSWGYSTGVTASDTKRTLVTFTYNYPNVFGPAGYPCDRNDHYVSTFSLFTYSPGASYCNVQILDNRGTAHTACNNKSGQIGIVITDALYGDSRNHASEFLTVRPILL